MADSLHPNIDKGLPKKKAKFAGGTLVCACVTNPVTAEIKGQVAHNHACGCTKCWKPKGAMFSVVAVVPTENVTVTANKSKLKVVDPKALIQRHACRACGVHMYGPVEREHAFQGLSFIHPERFQQPGWAPPGFAAFVSSIIESGVAPAKMKSVRTRLKNKGLEPYDCLNPALMDVLATFAAKKSGALPA
ncbi:MAG TPA: S-(hydroxymethyl)glutathione synthase [Rhizobiaceae bacterium]|nr:S-(hydroxymethyl)glutathione synthase [Rhizobiaceae bacterium]